MKFTVPAEELQQPVAMLRKAGYTFFVDPVTKKESYIIKLTSGFYPRFHLYVEEQQDAITFDLHLDQKKPSYKGTSAHGGEYDGPVVEKELERIQSWAKYYGWKGGEPQPATKQEAQQQPEESPPAKQNTGLFGGIF